MTVEARLCILLRLVGWVTRKRGEAVVERDGRQGPGAASHAPQRRAP